MICSFDYASFNVRSCVICAYKYTLESVYTDTLITGHNSDPSEEKLQEEVPELWFDVNSNYL